ncbi:hypothetical protein G6F68_012826 [Rhizopus microsporus]|nr:hypothetical protein G6F68_012826 [Rhizopus microsporus]
MGEGGRVLADHHQAAVGRRQRCRQLQPMEMTLQWTDAAGIKLASAVAADQRAQGLGGDAGRLVQQHADPLGLVIAGLLGHHDHGVVVDRALRLFHHLAIDRDPAALDVAPGFAARDAEQGGQAFVETDRFHGGRVARAAVGQLGQVQAGVEFQLQVVRLHVLAQLVEGLVVVGFLQVGQFMHHDHAQECRRRLAEHGGDADLAAGLEATAVYAGDGGVGAQRVLDHFQRVVVADLSYSWRSLRTSCGSG